MVPGKLPAADMTIEICKANERTVSGDQGPNDHAGQMPNDETKDETFNCEAMKKSKSFSEQRWEPKLKDGNSPDKKGHFSVPKPKSGLELRYYTQSPTPVHPPPPFDIRSPRDDVYKIRSPTWVDDQIGPAVGRTRSWRICSDGAPIPTWDPGFQVQIYSPGASEPRNMVMIEYLAERQKGIAAARLDPCFRGQSCVEKKRITKEFQEYLKERRRLFGTEEEDWEQMDGEKKEVVMAFYAQRKIDKKHQAKLDLEERKNTGNLSYSEYIDEQKEQLGIIDCLSEESLVKMKMVMKGWVAYKEAKLERKKQHQPEKISDKIGPEPKIPFSLRKPFVGAKMMKLPKLDTSTTNVSDLFVNQDSMSSTEKKTSSIEISWLFPDKQKRSSAEQKGTGSEIRTIMAAAEDPDPRNKQRRPSDNPTVGKKLSFLNFKLGTSSAKASPASESFGIDTLITRSHSDFASIAEKPQYTNTPAQFRLPSPRLPVESDNRTDLTTVGISGSTPIQHNPTSPISPASTIKASSSNPRSVLNPILQSKSSGSSLTMSRSVSFADVRSSVNESGGQLFRSIEELNGPLSNFVIPLSDNMIFDENLGSALDENLEGIRTEKIPETLINAFRAASESSQLKTINAEDASSGGEHPCGRPKTRKTVVGLEQSSEVGESAKAAHAHPLVNETGKSDLGQQHHDPLLCTTSPDDNNRCLVDEYLALGVTLTPDDLDETSTIHTQLQEQLAPDESELILREPGTPSSVYSDEQSSLNLFSPDIPASIVQVLGNRSLLDSIDTASTIKQTGAAGHDTGQLRVPNDIPHPTFNFAYKFPADNVSFGTDPTPDSGSFELDKSAGDNDDTCLEMKITRKLVGSGNSKSSAPNLYPADIPFDSSKESSSKAAQMEVSRSDFEDGSLDRPLCSSWVSTDSEAAIAAAALPTTSVDPCHELNVPELMQEELRRRELRHEALVEHKIEELRTMTGTLRLYPSPRTRRDYAHPNHLRAWNAKNLWCTECQGACAVCKAPCCAYYGAWKTFTDLSQPNNVRWTAYDLLKRVPRLSAVGLDEGTFMDCTSCHKMVCPNCCGICPRMPCYDRQCQDCKSNPWEPCSFHESM